MGSRVNKEFGFFLELVQNNFRSLQDHKFKDLRALLFGEYKGGKMINYFIKNQL